MKESLLKRFIFDPYYPDASAREYVRNWCIVVSAIIGAFAFLLFVVMTPFALAGIRPQQIETEEEVQYAISFYATVGPMLFWTCLVLTCLFSYSFVSTAGRKGKVVTAICCTLLNCLLAWGFWMQPKLWGYWLEGHRATASSGLVAQVSKQSFIIENFSFWASLLLAGLSVGMLGGALNNTSGKEPRATEAS